jgi:osmoprotectant transport system permease protein
MSASFAEQLANLPQYLGAHVMLVAIALCLGALIALPTAVLAAKSRARVLVLSVASVVQTIPSLALLALMVPLLGAFGFWPALVALVLYSMLPMLRNTITGIAGVDAQLVEAAQGLGMTKAQVLRRVELPLALPVIVAGIRTSAVWVVGVATLSTPVGQTSLGNYIFGGLQTRNWTAVLFGCVGAALLALLLDAILALLERAASSRRPRQLWLGSVCLLALLSLGAAAPVVFAPHGAAAPPSATSAPATEVRDIDNVRVGSKTFTEQYILAALLEKRLTAAGLKVTRAESLGSSVAFDALRDSQIDVYVDYSGTLWANAMKRKTPEAAWRVEAELSAWLVAKHGIRSLGRLGFENAYALTMRKDRARALGIRSISELAQHAGKLELGSDYEFFERPEWPRLRDTYGLGFRAKTSFDSTFMYEALKDGRVDVITAFSSDGRIAAYDLVTLSDPKHAFPPYDALLLLSPRVASDARIVAALSPLVESIPVAAIRQANLLVDRDEDKKTPAQAAERLLQLSPGLGAK